MIVFDQLAARARAGGATALRWRTPGGWVHLGWAELEQAIATRAAGLSLSPGAVADAGDDPLLALAILAMGATIGAGQPPGEGKTAPPPAGWWVTRRKELREGDSACGRVTHAALMAWAERAGAGIAGPVLMVAPGRGAFGALLVAVATGVTLVIDEGEPVDQHASTWIVAPERLRALDVRPSRLGRLGAAARRAGHAPAWMGPALRVVCCNAPELASTLASRGVTLLPDLESPCAYST